VRSLFCSFVLWMLALQPALATKADVVPAPVIQLSQAVFHPGLCHITDGAVFTPVNLPDQWGVRGVKTPSDGCYRITFGSNHVLPDQILAFRFDRLSARHTIYLNDRLIRRQGWGPVNATRTTAEPSLIDVPAGLLRQGANTLLVEVHYDYPSRAGLSFVSLGDAAIQAQAFSIDQLFSREIPQTINLAAAGLSLILILIWCLRPREQTLGLFGFLFLLGSIRNYLYFVAMPIISVEFSDWLMFCTQLWTFVAAIAFVCSLLGVQHARWINASLSVAVALSLLAWALTRHPESLHLLRRLVYPWVLCGLLVPIMLLISRARATNDPLLWALVCGFGLVLGAGCHDFLVVIGMASVRSSYWLPYAMPLVFVVFALMLVRRFVGTMNGIEAVHATLEQKVADRTSALAVANAAKSHFLAAASHDLRQPLHALGLSIAGLSLRAATSDVPIFQRIQQTLCDLDGMLKGILDLSRLESGGVTVKMQPCLLQELLEHVQKNFEELAHGKGLRLKIVPTRLAARRDPVLLLSILSNLVSNALKYTHRGGVLAGCRRRGGMIRLEVWDTGEGIEASELQQVFDEFYQVTTAHRRPVSGFGLGLAIVDRYARLLGHRITVHSRPGRGSCFALELPACAAPPTSATPHLQGELVGCFIVVIDNDETVLQANQELLQAWECHTIAKKTANEVLTALQKHLRTPDLILCDMHLGAGSDGISEITHIRGQLQEAIPAIIISGDSSPSLIEQVEQAGLVFLQKPLSPEHLRKEIIQLLRHEKLHADSPADTDF
jgi:signal transduction histidine kinase/CheY-like chemotaxis protein